MKDRQTNKSSNRQKLLPYGKEMDRKKLDNLTQQFSLIQENDNYNEICETFEKNIKHFVILL